MANPRGAVSLTEAPIVTPLDTPPPETGAVVDFWGVVRLMEEGREISGIDYEAHHAMAEHQLRAIMAEATAKFDLTQIHIEHRLGFVPVGEPSLFVRVGGRHRAESFQDVGWIVGELKTSATIWKQPRFLTKKQPERNSAAAEFAASSEPL